MRFDQLQCEKRDKLFSFREKTEIEILSFVNEVCQGNIIVGWVNWQPVSESPSDSNGKLCIVNWHPQPTTISQTKVDGMNRGVAWDFKLKVHAHAGKKSCYAEGR